MDKKKYEVAISCLKEDEKVARELYDLLQPRVGSLFLYTQNQKDLIGEDGLEAFGRAYRHESRVVVVIYREGWGKTKWTGVEDRAIRDLYLDHGWNRIFVYSMDDSAPVWLPETFLWGGRLYGLTALAAAIERKIKEEGGNVGEEDIVARAQRIQRSLAAAKEREDRRFSTEAVQAAYRERKAVDARLADVVSNLAASDPGLLHGQMISGMYTVLTNEVAVAFRWDGNTVNSIQGDKLTLYMSSGPLKFRWTDGSREVAKYELELTEDNAAWRWVEIGSGLYYTSVELANKAVRLLMDEHERRRKAAIQRQRRS